MKKLQVQDSVERCQITLKMWLYRFLKTYYYGHIVRILNFLTIPTKKLILFDHTPRISLLLECHSTLFHSHTNLLKVKDTQMGRRGWEGCFSKVSVAFFSLTGPNAHAPRSPAPGLTQSLQERRGISEHESYRDLLKTFPYCCLFELLPVLLPMQATLC